MFVVKYNSENTLSFLIPSIFAELGAATGVYYWKSKSENKIKMTLNAVQELSQIDDLTEEQVRQLQEIGILPSGDNIELKNNINSREEYLQYQISLLKTLREVLIKCKGDGLTDSDIIYNRENVETGPVKYLHKNKPSKQ